MLTASLLIALAATAQPPQDMLAARVTALESRVSALEEGLRDRRTSPAWLMKPDGLADYRPAGHTSGRADGHAGHGGMTYAEARAAAIRDGKPLVVWVGGGDALCPSCMHRLADEDGVVNVAAPNFPDTPAQALVIGMPENGDLVRVATITRWVTGDPTWGHVASIRRAVRNWREHRAVMSGGWSLDTAPVRRAAGTAWGGVTAAAGFRPAAAGSRAGRACAS